MSGSPPKPDYPSNTAAFLGGYAAAWRSVFPYTLFGMYIGIGALAHDLGFSADWMVLSTLLVWAGPAQVILISTLGGGASHVDVAIAVSLSGVRLLPMVVALLPLLRTETTRTRHLALIAHLTAISMWVESLRLLPAIPRERRIAFCHGLGAGLMTPAVIASVLGFYLAAKLPVFLAGALLFLTPLSFALSIARNSQSLIDRAALVLGGTIGPVLAMAKVGLDLMWTGVVAGTIAYLIDRWRRAAR